MKRWISCLLAVVGGFTSGGKFVHAEDPLEGRVVFTAQAGAADKKSPVAVTHPSLQLKDFVVGDPRVWRIPGRSGHDFWGGAGVAFLGHETGHLVTNLLIGSTPRLESVHYGFVPFFTWEPDHKLSDRNHYLTASGGFNAQHLCDEWILTRHPRLKDENNPYFKGMLTFSYWLSVGYGLNALTGGGPDKRDTKGMADAARVSEALIGVLVLSPALLDAYRYNHPGARWARRASRAVKLLTLGLAVRARR